MIHELQLCALLAAFQPAADFFCLSTFLIAVGIATIVSLLVSILTYFGGDPNALIRPTYWKNCFLSFPAAMTASVVLLLFLDVQGIKLSYQEFMLVLLGTGLVSGITAWGWLYLLLRTGCRKMNFEESDFSDPRMRRRRWGA